MKCRLLLKLLLLLCAVSPLRGADYGLYFHAYQKLGTGRTSLRLDDGEAFKLGREFRLDFDMLVRNEPKFGAVFHLEGDSGRDYHFIFAAGEHNRNFPALLSGEGMFAIDAPIVQGRWIPVSFRFFPADDKVSLRFDTVETTLSIPLHAMQQARVSFGRASRGSTDTAPIVLRDVCVTVDDQLLRHWKLDRHNGDVCLDELTGAEAVATAPYWLIDNHIEWQEIYRKRIAGRFGVAFNARDAVFYFVYPDAVRLWSEQRDSLPAYPITGGYPAMEYPGHLLYDTLTNRLLSYSLDEGLVSALVPEEGRWTLTERHPVEPHFYNHAKAYNPLDSSFYFFGGYGFYQYRNELYAMNVATGRIRRVIYTPSIEPRCYSAAGVLGNELYILGGRGNRQGRQEFEAFFKHDLHAIDLRTGKSRLVWSRADVRDMMLMAASMYYEPADSSFYAVSMRSGGTLWRIPLNDTTQTALSKPINNSEEYQDCDICLYAAPAHHKLYLVVDKILADRMHDLAIYSIDTPLMSDEQIAQQPVHVASRRDGLWWWSLAALLAVVLLGVTFRVLWRGKPGAACREWRRNARPKPAVDYPKLAGQPLSFQRNQPTIALLGSFSVRDKEGNDVAFTSRLKNMLILIILYSEKYPSGIHVQRLSRIFWPNKSDEEAHNNRNVTLSRLRLILSRLDEGTKIVNTNSFLHIVWGQEIFCDYHVVLDCIRRIRAGAAQTDEALMNQTLELLLRGPLLTNTHHDWLEDFKTEYSSMAIDFLRGQLHRVSDSGLLYHIANLLSLHDPLSEEALSVKCRLLWMQDKRDLARKTYDYYCACYAKSLGEPYRKSFSELCER